MKREIRNDPPKWANWHRWFAWHPVKAHGNDGRDYRIWLETVERKGESLLDAGIRWVYREVPPPPADPFGNIDDYKNGQSVGIGNEARYGRSTRSSYGMAEG